MHATRTPARAMSPRFAGGIFACGAAGYATNVPLDIPAGGIAMGAARTKKSRASRAAPGLDAAIERLSTRLSSCGALRRGTTLLFRATGDAGGAFHLEASDRAVRLTRSPGMTPYGPT